MLSLLCISRTRVRLLALLTCLLFFSALLESLAHQATVAHGYCSDHGQLIHLSADPRTVPPHGPSSASLHRDRHLSGAHGCPALDFLLSCWSLTGDHGAGALIDSQASRRRKSGRVLPELAIPVLLQAPKSSPPVC